jgi:hypothetical protein
LDELSPRLPKGGGRCKELKVHYARVSDCSEKPGAEVGCAAAGEDLQRKARAVGNAISTLIIYYKIFIFSILILFN